MAISPAQCIQRLSSGELPRILMLFGDEPQQKLDVTDKWREAAKSQQFDERYNFVAESDFDWQQLATTANTLSLFSEKQVIELTLPTGKPGNVGASALIEFAESGNNDTALLLCGPAINQSVKNAKWFKSIEKHAVFCQCFELKGSQLTQYLEQYARKLKLKIDRDALNAIADMNEGNLLAAKQEIDKVSLAFSQDETINFDNIASSLTTHSKFSVFELTDTLLAGNASKAVNILSRLEQEGAEPNVIVWNLINEAQRLEDCMLQRNHSGQINFSKMRIWQSKQRFYLSALERLDIERIRMINNKLAAADLLFKTETVEKPFVVLAHLSLLFMPFDLAEIELA